MKSPRHFFYSILILLCFSSCDFFEPEYEYYMVQECCTGQCSVIGNINEMEGHVVYIQSNIQGQYFDKWLILPDQPSDKIYLPCNLPDTLKRDWQKIWFRGHVVDDNFTDTLVAGMEQIELTQIWTEK